MTHHLSIFTPALWGLAVLSAAGYVGVTFFFILSGFVLTYSWTSKSRPGQFYRHRFARVFPVHVLFLGLAVATFGHQRWSALPANLMLVQAWAGSDSIAFSFNPVAWSLSCEVFFYVALPLVVVRLRRTSRPLVLASLLLAGAMVVGAILEVHDLAWGAVLYHLPPFRFVEFLCGCLVAVALSRGWRPRIRMAPAAAFVVTSYLAVLVLPTFIGYRVEDRWALSLVMVPSFMALIGVCAHRDISDARTPLRGATLVSFGQWSYCLYMAHQLILVHTQPLLASSSQLAAALGCVIVVAAVLGVSYLTHATFERPLERRLRGRTPARISDEALSEHMNIPPSLPVRPVLGERVWSASDADRPSAR